MSQIKTTGGDQRETTVYIDLSVIEIKPERYASNDGKTTEEDQTTTTNDPDQPTFLINEDLPAIGDDEPQFECNEQKPIQSDISRAVHMLTSKRYLLPQIHANCQSTGLTLQIRPKRISHSHVTTR